MADSYITYTEQSIQSAFKEHYLVPEYQREYVWEHNQVEQLLSDLLEAYGYNPDKAYFLGTIVTCKSANKFELIDGQQRMTTFFILLCTLKHTYKEAGEPTDFLQFLLSSSVFDDDGNTINCPHLTLQYEDAGDCLQRIESGAEPPESLSLSGQRLFSAADTIRKFQNEHFSNNSSLDMKALKKFVKFLLTKTSFIRIETTNVTDALKIFETINQRGKGLDSMDLLKNMIFRQVSRAEFETLNSNWKNILNALEKLDEKPLRFLRYFIMANYDTSSEKDGILREDRIYAWICENDAQCNYVKKPFEFVRRMQENVDLYAAYRNPSDAIESNIHLRDIPMLAGSSYKLHLMLLLAASHMEPQALDRFKEVLESVIYYAVINKIAPNVTERTFVSWCPKLRSIRELPELNAFVEHAVKPVVADWKQNNLSNFLRLGLDSMQQYRIKFILGKITAYIDQLRMNNPTVTTMQAYLVSSVEIEHIMPQNCSDKAGYGMTAAEFPVYLNRLGNLTLLENSLNKSIKNDPYPVKCTAYQMSAFYLTRSIPQLVYQGDPTAGNAINKTNKLLSSWNVWNKQSIEERQQMLYDLSERIWNIF